MAEKETTNIRIEDYLTPFKFAKKHGIPTKDTSKIDSLNRAMKKLSSMYAKNPAGNEASIVYKNRKCHNGNSAWLVPPFFESRVLTEYNNQEMLKAKKNQRS